MGNQNSTSHGCHHSVPVTSTNSSPGRSSVPTRAARLLGSTLESWGGNSQPILAVLFMAIFFHQTCATSFRMSKSCPQTQGWSIIGFKDHLAGAMFFSSFVDCHIFQQHLVVVKLVFILEVWKFLSHQHTIEIQDGNILLGRQVVASGRSGWQHKDLDSILPVSQSLSESIHLYLPRGSNPQSFTGSSDFNFTSVIELLALDEMISDCWFREPYLVFAVSSCWLFALGRWGGVTTTQRRTTLYDLHLHFYMNLMLHLMLAAGVRKAMAMAPCDQV